MNNFLTVLKKELLDIFRDRKAILFTILLPIILYPVMFKFISSAVTDMENDVQKEINIVIEGDLDSDIALLLLNEPNIKTPSVNNNKDALKNGDIQAIIVIPENFPENSSNNSLSTIQILYDEESNKSLMASQLLSSIFENYKYSLVESKLIANGLDASVLNPFQIEVKSGINTDSSENNGFGTIMLSMLPSLLVIFMVSSTLAMAADLGAGEKERCTFEPLLSTPAIRSSILWGKIVALCSISFLTLIVNMIAMVFSMNSFMNYGGSLEISLTPTAILGIIGISLFLLVTLSALQMAISLYARSSKEAGTYLSGVMIPTMLLSYLPMMMDAKSIKLVFFNIPVANAVCLMKEFMVGIFNVQHILIVVIWHILYVVSSILFAKYMFSKEEVIFRN
ncbi:ABC transporter permease [Clostridium celatum]|uniref:ABC transporter permease n=1 Tax=Clostridium celatum TaxID=36834 RepID=UPI001FAE3E26|nr:ABC transporter permease [Clostridium celatum]